MTRPAKAPDDEMGAEGEAGELAALTWKLRSIVARMQMTDRDRLAEFAEVGRLLLSVKELVASSPRGSFGEWCDANFPASKEWRARLMRLAREWEDFTKAERWAKAQGRALGSREYSVDGALAFVAEWRKHREVAGFVRGAIQRPRKAPGRGSPKVAAEAPGRARDASAKQPRKGH